MTITVITIVAVVSYLAASVYGAAAIMKIPRLPLEQAPIGLDYEDVTFVSRGDNTKLEGWLLLGGSRVVITVTGGYQNRSNPKEGTLELGADLVREGYSVLLFDLRGRGKSEGKALALTNTEKDIGGAIDFVKAKGYPDVSIVAFSTGAVSALSFAAKEKVTAIVADSCLADVTKALIIRVNGETGMPKPIIRFLCPGIFLMAKAIYGYSKVDPVGMVPLVQCPVLFIHSEKDYLTAGEDIQRLFLASNNPKDELWVIEGAEHCQGYNTNSEQYVKRVVSFLEASSNK